ncbi:hypothetical protein QCN29_05125 [Streptomyces sp. HNM0663]|uniref:Uncharacterized protein n=1 Tax=Streptomyces chengmaiensis TaxID=3040919 RepID=A0ABT6HHE2_9ACTN|nr:hypothetical protein [Streptomyces chengmaiensis]MDH2388181.1 hypothetical protein [Streptomyces chengmaiensis]
MGSKTMGAVTGMILGNAVAPIPSDSLSFAAQVLLSLVGAEVGDPLKVTQEISKSRFHKENQLAMFVLDVRDLVSDLPPGQ